MFRANAANDRGALPFDNVHHRDARIALVTTARRALDIPAHGRAFLMFTLADRNLLASAIA
jgi:hypothetical protein